MSNYREMFSNKMSKWSGIQIDENEIVSDGKFHLVNSNQFYAVSVTKPPVGYFGYINCERPEKWRLCRKNADEEKAYKSKCKALRKVVKQGLDSLDVKRQAPFSLHTKDSSDEVVVMRLASLTVCEYERVRKNEASKLNVRVSVLDKLVDQARKKIQNCRLLNKAGQLEFTF